MCDFMSAGQLREFLAIGDRKRDLVSERCSLLRLRLCFGVVPNDERLVAGDEEVL